MNLQLPFFFYGTLRPGERNYNHLLQGHTLREEAGWWLEGAQLYLHASGSYTHLKGEGAGYQPQGAYPYLRESIEGTSRVAGDLIEIRPEHYEKLLVELDWLEGYSEEVAPEETNSRNEYLRVVREIKHLSGASTQAWVYLGTPQAFARQAAHLTPLVSGDWLEWRSLDTHAK